MLPIIVKMLRVVSLQARYICGVSIILRTMVHNSAKLARQFAEEKKTVLAAVYCYSQVLLPPFCTKSATLILEQREYHICCPNFILRIC